VDDVDRRLQGRSGYQLGQEAAGRSVGGAACFTRRGKRGEGERKERGARRRRGGALLQGVGAAEWKLGGSDGEWHHAAGGREGGPGGAWREGGSEGI
jgi:hypothetical protein